MNGSDVRAARQSIGATMNDVAREIGCSLTFLHHMETGKRRLSAYWGQRLREILPAIKEDPPQMLRVKGPRTGADIKRIRKMLGLTQNEMGEVIGVTGSFLGMVERGRVPLSDWLRHMIHLRYGEFIE